MIPTFLAFQTASRALAASQTSINITGNNIANVDTDGYSRQRVDLNSISSSGFTEKYRVANSSTSLGVEVTGIKQIRDSFLDSRYRMENTDNGLYHSTLSGLTDLEDIFDEIETKGLQSELSEFINQLQDLSQKPTSQDIALVVRTSAQKITQILNVFANQINQVQAQARNDLTKIVIDNDFNSIVKNIADLNVQIKQEQVYGNTPNELLDKRNTLIDQLSGIANIKVSSTPEKISDHITVENLSITLSGTTIELVNNGLYNTFSAMADPSDGTVAIMLNNSFGSHESKDISAHITGGSIRGYLNIINGAGSYAKSSTNPAGAGNPFRGTLYYQKSMDTFASTFAEIFNTLNDLDPGDGIAKPLFKASDNSTVITAANITISDEWLNNPSYISTTSSTTESGGNDNVLKMIEAMNKGTEFYLDGATKTGLIFKGTFHEYMSGMTGELSLDINLQKNFEDTSNKVLSNLYDMRESVSGVLLDEEGINLMAFQKSYQAAARYMTALDEAVDTIINSMGLVGR